MNPSKDPPVPTSELILFEWARYDWQATGSLNTYLYRQRDRYFMVVHCDIRHLPGSTNTRQAGWESPQEIDSHRYAHALARARMCPPIPDDIYERRFGPPARLMPEISEVED